MVPLISLTSFPVTAEESRIGKSNITILTDDVYAAGLDVPDEYQDEKAMIQFSDDEPIEGKICIINATIFNIGTRSASITVYFYDGNASLGDLIGTDTLTIMPLGHGLASTDWDTTGEAEFHTIFVYINTDDPANETDDSNNQANKDIVVNQIPWADAGPDQEEFEDRYVEFNATLSTDTPSDLSTGLTYTWDFNDPYSDPFYFNPGVISGKNVTNPLHYFEKSGVYTVTLTVQDDGGAKATDTMQVTIENMVPTAKVRLSNKFVFETEEVTVESASWDSNSDIENLLYLWEFEDGNTTGWTNVSAVTLNFTLEGFHWVKLTVKDDDNATDETLARIDVYNKEPNAVSGGDRVSDSNTVIFNASGTTDTMNDMDTLNYTWDFGDRTTGYGLTVTHTYESKGTYYASLTVMDNDGSINIDKFNVTVRNIAPISVIDTDQTRAYEDQEVFFDGSGSYDTVGSITGYRWHFGDGTEAEGKSVQHAFAKAGTYRVYLFVTDDDDVESRTSIDITVVNIKPTANAGENMEVYIDEEITFNGNGSFDTPSDLELLDYHWDYGDGQTGEGIIVTHNYSESGVFEVVLTVTDDNGASAVHKIRVYVRATILSSIEITAHLDPATCEPGQQVVLSGEINYDFIDRLPDADINPAKLRIEILETGTSWQILPDMDGSYSHTFEAPGTPGTYTLKISITRLGLLAEETETLTVTEPGAAAPAGPAGTSIVTIAAAAIVITITASSAAFIAGTDLGKYKFFTLLIPLYSKLNKNALLDNFTRGRIYEHIRMHPGEHYRSIKTNLELNNGCLTYHLKVLEQNGLIQSRTDGTHKRFYPAGMKIEKGQPSNIQEHILQKIHEMPYSTQREIANEIGIDVSTVNYHVNIMVGAGIIQSEKSGKTKRYFAAPEVEAM